MALKCQSYNIFYNPTDCIWVPSLPPATRYFLTPSFATHPTPTLIFTVSIPPLRLKVWMLKGRWTGRSIRSSVHYCNVHTSNLTSPASLSHLLLTPCLPRILHNRTNRLIHHNHLHIHIDTRSIPLSTSIYITILVTPNRVSSLLSPLQIQLAVHLPRKINTASPSLMMLLCLNLYLNKIQHSSSQSPSKRMA